MCTFESSSKIQATSKINGGENLLSFDESKSMLCGGSFQHNACEIYLIPMEYVYSQIFVPRGFYPPRFDQQIADECICVYLCHEMKMYIKHTLYRRVYILNQFSSSLRN